MNKLQSCIIIITVTSLLCYKIVVTSVHASCVTVLMPASHIMIYIAKLFNSYNNQRYETYNKMITSCL